MVCSLSLMSPHSKNSEMSGGLQDEVRELLQADRAPENYSCVRLTFAFFVDTRARVGVGGERRCEMESGDARPCASGGVA